MQLKKIASDYLHEKVGVDIHPALGRMRTNGSFVVVSFHIGEAAGWTCLMEPNGTVYSSYKLHKSK
jgi:dolichyl-phosphate-mannose--protein O-mannosyl transferase